MKSIALKEGKDTPYYIFDPERQKFEMGGKCIPEDADAFFQPILLWVKQYAKKPNNETNFVFKLEYFNTVSLRKILEIFKALNKIPTAQIIWFMHEDDDDFTHLTEMLKIPFIIKYFEDE
jgi:hypothetical protein